MAEQEEEQQQLLEQPSPIEDLLQAPEEIEWLKQQLTEQAEKAALREKEIVEKSIQHAQEVAELLQVAIAYRKLVTSTLVAFQPNPLPGAASLYTKLRTASVSERRSDSCWTVCLWGLHIGLQLNQVKLSTSDSIASSSTGSSSAEYQLICGESPALDSFTPDWREMLVEFRTTCHCVGREIDGPYGKQSASRLFDDEDGYRSAETTFNGLFASHISGFLGTKRVDSGLIWLQRAPTRHDLSESSMHGLLALRTEQTRYHMPLLFVEFIVSNESSVVSKRAKAFALATKTLTPSTKAVLGCIIQLPQTPWKQGSAKTEQDLVEYELRLYCRSSIKPAKIADILLDKGKFDFDKEEGVTKFAELLACSELLKNCVIKDIDNEFLPVVYPQCKVLHLGNYGFKCYPQDSVTSAAERAQRRWEYDIKFLPNCEILVENTTTVLIRYDWTEGLHIATHSSQFRHVLEHLRKLHSNGVVHGDIRLSTIVFTEPHDKSILVDFDIAGKVGKGKYPARFNPTVFDGTRHEDATARNKLQFEHDLFSMAGVMEFFSPAENTQQQQQQQWQGIIRALRSNSESLDTVITMLSSKEMQFPLGCDASLRAKLVCPHIMNAQNPFGMGTGNPPIHSAATIVEDLHTVAAQRNSRAPSATSTSAKLTHGENKRKLDTSSPSEDNQQSQAVVGDAAVQRTAKRTVIRQPDASSLPQ